MKFPFDLLTVLAPIWAILFVLKSPEDGGFDSEKLISTSSGLLSGVSPGFLLLSDCASPNFLKWIFAQMTDEDYDSGPRVLDPAMLPSPSIHRWRRQYGRTLHRQLVLPPVNPHLRGVAPSSYRQFGGNRGLLRSSLPQQRTLIRRPRARRVPVMIRRAVTAPGHFVGGNRRPLTPLLATIPEETVSRTNSATGMDESEGTSGSSPGTSDTPNSFWGYRFGHYAYCHHWIGAI